MDELDERTTRVIHRLWSRHETGRLRPPELDVDAEMRREAVYRLDTAAQRMPDRPRIAALSLAIWLTTTTSSEATEAARVLLGHAGPSDEIR